MTDAGHAAGRIWCELNQGTVGGRQTLCRDAVGIVSAQDDKFVRVLCLFQILPEENIEQQKGGLTAGLYEDASRFRNDGSAAVISEGGCRRDDKEGEVSQQNPGDNAIRSH
jgi:hypothetical protein